MSTIREGSDESESSSEPVSWTALCEVFGDSIKTSRAVIAKLLSKRMQHAHPKMPLNGLRCCPSQTSFDMPTAQWPWTLRSPLGRRSALVSKSQSHLFPLTRSSQRATLSLRHCTSRWPHGTCGHGFPINFSDRCDPYIRRYCSGLRGPSLVFGIGAPCVIVDLRRFDDPSTRNDLNLNLRSHIGWNQTVMVQLVMNESFRQTIGRALTLGLREHECDVFKCMAGRHRT